MGKPRKKSPGRPQVTDKEGVVSLLVTSFHSGLTVREACWQAGISHEAYYSRLRVDEQFADTMARAQSVPTTNARKVVIEAINKGDVGTARWWLERKAKDEFVKDSTEATKQPYIDPEELERGIDELIRLREIRKTNEDGI